MAENPYDPPNVEPSEVGSPRHGCAAAIIMVVALAIGFLGGAADPLSMLLAAVIIGGIMAGIYALGVHNGRRV